MVVALEDISGHLISLVMSPRLCELHLPFVMLDTTWITIGRRSQKVHSWDVAITSPVEIDALLMLKCFLRENFDPLVKCRKY